MREKEYVLRDDFGRDVIRSYHSVLTPQIREHREHHHTECELSVFLAGSGIYAIHGKEYPFAAGDVFLFGSNEAHCITRIDTPMDLLNVHFEPRVLWERTDSVELLSLFAARSKSFCNRFADRDGGLGRLLLDLEGELAEDRPCRGVATRYLLFSALVQMIRGYDCVDPQKSVGARSSVTQSLRDAMQYINENLSAKLTLAQIAAVACMSPTYFCAVFKQLNGVSPFEYITIKRVELAVSLLGRERLNKLEIATRCGFSGSSNFYKAFRRITGKAPQDFVGK